jgi:hypothetical protein
MLNTGVIVMQPKKHGTFLKGVYDKYIQKSVRHPRHFHYEQSAIGYELHVNNKFVVLPNTWNAIWYVYRYENMSLEQFSKTINFLHFAGMGANSGQKTYNINALYK